MGIKIMKNVEQRRTEKTIKELSLEKVTFLLEIVSSPFLDLKIKFLIIISNDHKESNWSELGFDYKRQL